MQTVNFQAPTDYSAEQEQIARSRKYAELMQAQSMQPMGDTQMAGGWAIRNSPFQGLAKMVQAYSGKRGQEDADERQKRLASALRGETQNDILRAQEAFSGTPANSDILKSRQGLDSFDPQEAKPANPQAGLNILAGSQNPALAQAGTSALLSAMMPKAPKWEKVEKPNPDGSKVVGYVDINSPSPWSTFQAGGTAPVKNEYVNGQAVQPYTNTPQGAAIPVQNNPFKDLVVPDGSGGVKPNAPLVKVKETIAKLGAPSVNVSTDKGYFGELARNLAGQDAALIDAARSAPERMRTAASVREILDKTPITGTGAEARLALNKALATAGVIDGKTVQDTETLASLLANQTLDAIKTSGLGSGQGFTDKDRQFLERAKSGNIEINAGTLRTLAELNERTAKITLQRGNEVIRKLNKNPNMGNVGPMLQEFQEPVGAGGAKFLGFEEKK